ncbi:hypothetical protein BC938DRAFT_471199 [Jimgerdemannia flammicorona]|uniref:Uncharacterized protein n=1 Tax=Jimgerdemannia flammicorona TaxID=994334 RepID=A0A433Q8L7_9FUNG|nr:hypothetical protein BC938DRAFT_471199 [Jimgerdemannia flammicorona]
MTCKSHSGPNPHINPTPRATESNASPLPKVKAASTLALTPMPFLLSTPFLSSEFTFNILTRPSPGRRPDPRFRPPHRRLPLQWRRRAACQYHRQRRPNHASTHGIGRRDAG